MTRDLPSPASFGTVRALRREKMLDAAERLFVSQGYRGVTMEALAGAAGVSKVTIYAYFRDKDAAFHAVAERFAERLKDAVSQALDGDLPLSDRIGNALVAKHAIVFDVVRSSSFANELFAAKDRVVGELFRRLDGEIEAMLARTMANTGIDQSAADETARLLFGAAQGIADHDRDLQTAAADIAALVDAMIRHLSSRADT